MIPQGEDRDAAGHKGWLTRLCLEKHVQIALLLVGVSALAYGPAISGPFFSDDVLYVRDNETLASVPLLESWRVFTERTNPYEYLPLRDLSFRVDMAFFGSNPVGYHLHNILLYLLCSLSLWFCTREMLRVLGIGRERAPGFSTGERAWIASATVILFAAHPAHVESVAWISGRKNLLSGLFLLLSCWQFARFLTMEIPRWGPLARSLAFFLLALASKLAVIPFPAVAALLTLAASYSGTTSSVTLRRAWIATAGLITVTVAWIIFHARWGSTGIVLDPLLVEAHSRAGMFEAAIMILGYLVRIALCPTQLRLLYDVFEPGIPAVVACALGIVGCLSLVAGLFATWFRGSRIGFGAAWFILFCLPFLQIVPFQTWSLASERFLFLPLVGLALILAVGMVKLSAIPRTLLLVVLAIAGSYMTLQQSEKWATPLELHAEAAQLTPELARLAIMEVYLPEGRYSEAEEAAARPRAALERKFLLALVRAERAVASGDLEGASEFIRQLELLTDSFTRPRAQVIIGDYHARSGRDYEAIRRYLYALRYHRSQAVTEKLRQVRARHEPSLTELRKRLAEKPGDITVLAELASYEMELFYLDEAEERYRSILRQFPGLPTARYNLGLTLMRKRQFSEAVIELQAAVDGGIDRAAAWNNLGLALKENVEIERAAAAFRTALERDPRHWHAGVNMGRMYLMLGENERARQAFDAARDRIVDDASQLQYVEAMIQACDER